MRRTFPKPMHHDMTVHRGMEIKCHTFLTPCDWLALAVPAVLEFSCRHLLCSLSLCPPTPPPWTIICSFLSGKNLLYIEFCVLCCLIAVFERITRALIPIGQHLFWVTWCAGICLSKCGWHGISRTLNFRMKTVERYMKSICCIITLLATFRLYINQTNSFPFMKPWFCGDVAYTV